MRKCLFLVIVFCFGVVFQSVAQNVFGNSNVLYIASVDGSLGMMLEPREAPENDVLTLKGGDRFVLTVSQVKANQPATGKLVVALVRKTQVVAILATKTLNAATTTSLGSMYFSCRIAEDVEVEAGDEIQLLFTVNETSYQKVARVYSGTTDAIPATGYILPVCKINYPQNVPGVTITSSTDNVWPDKTVKGRNFYLYIIPDDPETTVVVRADGNPWIKSSDNYLYALSGVMQDVDIEIKSYPAGTVYPYKEIECTSSVRVADVLTEAEADCLRGLRVKGEVMAEDFPFFRDRMMSLQILDLTLATVEDDVIPERAFDSNNTIQEVKLPESIIALRNNAFRYTTKLSFIVLPENLCLFGLNEFFGSTVNTVWAKWDAVKHYDGLGLLTGFPIPPCAFRATVCFSEGTLIVPKGCVDAYRQTENWGSFKTIREPLPIDFKLELPFDRFLPTGIEESQGGDNDKCEFSIETAPGECRIIQENPVDRKIEVIDAGGRICETKMAEGWHTIIPLKSGFYIIRVSGESRKVMIP